MAPDLVVIVGAGPGLGRAVGRAFADAGAHVALLARDAARLDAMSAELDAATGVPVDVTDEAALRGAFASIRAELGDPTVLVHNPSAAYEATATATPLDVLLDGFALAAGSLLVAAQEVAPAMRRAGQGTILVTGSVAATTGSTWSAALAAQKAAVRNLTLSLAAELGPAGVRVATITIAGTLGTPGFEVDRIAAEYVRLATGDRTAPWTVDVPWPPVRS
jgi:NAD(P)-dependent dehydrogenase (short-subunit alcohol dehydrogenase family)